MLPTKFPFTWPSGFKGEDILEIDQSETRIACGGHVYKRIRTKCAIFIEDLPQMLATNFGSFGQVVSEEKTLKNSWSQGRPSSSPVQSIATCECHNPVVSI